jgi:hypothetical protein
MGLGDLFRRRRERESAIPSSSTDAETLGSFAKAEGQPVIGQQVSGSGTQFSGTQGAGMAEGLAALANLGPMIQQAIASGNVQIEQDGAQTIDLRATGLREEILGIMQQNGIDAEQGVRIDASATPAFQQQILEALSKHGVDLSAAGQGFSVQFDPDDSRD